MYTTKYVYLQTQKAHATSDSEEIYDTRFLHYHIKMCVTTEQENQFFAILRSFFTSARRQHGGRRAAGARARCRRSCAPRRPRHQYHQLRRCLSCYIRVFSAGEERAPVRCSGGRRAPPAGQRRASISDFTIGALRNLTSLLTHSVNLPALRRLQGNLPAVGCRILWCARVSRVRREAPRARRWRELRQVAGHGQLVAAGVPVAGGAHK